MKVSLPNFEKRGGFIPVVAQDFRTKEVLMLAYTDPAGYRETLEGGLAVYFSTSRGKRWKKGEESGHTQVVRSVLVDCDGDALVYIVEPNGDACHAKARSCFFRTVAAEGQFMVATIGPKETLPVINAAVHENLRTMHGLRAS